MKNYMEDGTFSRGRDVINAEGSIVFVGNLNGDIQTIIRTSNLFYPMPKELDTAFFDRIHCYLPGWEFTKTRDELYTSHFGFVSDYLAEVMHGLRKTSYIDLTERSRSSQEVSANSQRGVGTNRGSYSVQGSSSHLWN